MGFRGARSLKFSWFQRDILQVSVFGCTVVPEGLRKIIRPYEADGFELLFSLVSVSRKGMNHIRHMPGMESRKVSPK